MKLKFHTLTTNGPEHFTVLCNKSKKGKSFSVINVMFIQKCQIFLGLKLFFHPMKSSIKVCSRSDTITPRSIPPAIMIWEGFIVSWYLHFSSSSSSWFLSTHIYKFFHRTEIYTKEKILSLDSTIFKTDFNVWSQIHHKIFRSGYWKYMKWKILLLVLVSDYQLIQIKISPYLILGDGGIFISN